MKSVTIKFAFVSAILWEGNSKGAIDQSILSVIKGVAGHDGVDGMKRLFNRREIMALCYQAMRDLTRNCSNPEQLDRCLIRPWAVSPPRPASIR